MARARAPALPVTTYYSGDHFRSRPIDLRVRPVSQSAPLSTRFASLLLTLSLLNA